MKIKVKLWIYVSNNGDGSASPIFFDSEEAAEAYAKNDDERFCDDIFPHNLEVDESGKLLTANPTRDW